MVKDIILTLLYMVVFNLLLYRFKSLRFKHFRPAVTYVLFNLKFLAGLAIWFIYTFYYTDIQNNDVHKFYNDALVLRQAASENTAAFTQLMTGIKRECLPIAIGTERSRRVTSEAETIANDCTKPYTSQMKNWDRNFDESPFNENRTIIRLNALLMFVSFKTYFVHILFMCFFSLLGWVLITNAVFDFTDKRNALLALPALFLPSVLFWISGVMKEPLLVLGLGLFINGILSFSRPGHGIWNLLFVIFGALIILFTKFFVLVCLLPAVIAYWLFNKREQVSFLLLKYGLVNVLLLLLAFNIHHIIPAINPVQMLANKQMHAVKEAMYFKAGSRIEIPELTNNAASVMQVAPVGLWNTLARPYLWEAKNAMMFASVLEILFIIPIVVFCVVFADWKKAKPFNLFLFLLSGSLTYFALIGMCTPVLGSLVRYKAPLLPLYLFAFALLMDPKYIARSLNFLLARND